MNEGKYYMLADRYSTDSLLLFVSEGRMTLQIPYINSSFVNGNPLCKKGDTLKTYPMQWYDKLWKSPKGYARPQTERQDKGRHTDFFISEECFYVNRSKFKNAFNFAALNGLGRGRTWNEFEEMALEHFKQLNEFGISKVKIK
jgi:hypothetical protein